MYVNLGNRLELECDECFPCGKIEICGTWASYEIIPENIKEAIILLTLEKAQPGVTGLSGSQGAVESVEWDDFKIDYNNSQIYSDVDTTGFFEIDRLLNNIPTSDQIKFSIIENTQSKCCKKGTNEC